MKLKKPNDAPPGGFLFVASDGQKIRGDGIRDLAIKVDRYYKSNDLTLPEGDLKQIIEDDICARAPAGWCWMGLGDNVASVIQGVAGFADQILGTNLAQTAKSCSSCAKRRRALNNLS